MSSVTTSARVAMSALLVSLLVAGCGGDSPDKMLASAKDYLAKNDVERYRALIAKLGLRR